MSEMLGKCAGQAGGAIGNHLTKACLGTPGPDFLKLKKFDCTRLPN